MTDDEAKPGASSLEELKPEVRARYGLTAPVSDVVERVAAELAEHLDVEHGFFGGDQIRVQCLCGMRVIDHQAHVAAAVVEALGLTEEWAEQSEGGYVHGRYDSQADAASVIAHRNAMYPNPKPSWPASRWVSPWVGVLSEQGSEQ